MPKFEVTLMSVASTVVSVEAESRNDAIDLAFEQAPTPAWDWPDMGDWALPSEMFPESNTEKDDVTELD